MKRILLPLLLITLLGTSVRAQVTSTAAAGSGSGYPALLTSGFQLEDPDCVHTDFGPHITQAFDAELGRNVFVFHSHIEEDNDRCIVFDRVRMEIKGSANSIPELRHQRGDTTYYRWKFRLDEGFIGASSFNHLYQNKAVGGDDSSFPILTITARANKVEVNHNGGDSGSALGSVAEANLTKFRGKWVEGYLRQVHDENGELDVTIRDMATGLTILEYSNNDIDLWRAGAELNRPKWGVYRSKNDVLRDEDVRFANFCVSEEAAGLCPAEAVLVPDTEAPTAPTGLTVTGTTFTTVNLDWEAAEDTYGVSSYVVFFDGDSTANTSEADAIISGLSPATTYAFTVTARDAAGNESAQSNAVAATTDDANALPDVASNPTPDDGAAGVSPQSGLGWARGGNTDGFEVFFGTEPDPASVGTQTANSYQPGMAPNTTYYWRVASINQNGTVTSEVWSFTTGDNNPDAPWYVYRGNARPEAETGFFDLNTAPVVPTLDVLFTDPDNAGNSIFGYRSDTDENFRWRFDLSDQDSTITIVARVRGIDDDASGMMHLDVRAFGWRQKVRLNSHTIKFERSSPTIEEDLPFDWNDDYHIVRLVVSGRTTTVYLDEDTTPFISGESNDERDQLYFEWGKSGGADYGAYVDWMAVNITEASAPTEGTDLPTDIILGATSTFDPLLQATIKVYPNPATQSITVELPTRDIYTAQFISMDGRSATGSFPISHLETVDVATLPKGFYILVVQSESGQLARTKLLID
jgi:chitodextrinase